MVEAVLKRSVQPYIHDIYVNFTTRNKECVYWVFFKRQRGLPLNTAVAALVPNTDVRGDIVVMHTGTQGNEVVNFCDDDSKTATLIIQL